MTAHPILAAGHRHWRKEYGLAVVAVAIAIIATLHINTPDKAPDFTVFWAAAQHAFGPVYDSDFLSPLQSAPPGPRPFAYPPTFLMMILPVSLMSFKVAYVVWVALSVTAFVASGLRASQFAWLALFSPTLLFAALIGQTTMIVGGLGVLGLTLAGSRPLLAGITLGVAGCIKPQLLILTPLALIMLRDFRAMAAAATTAVMLCLAATVIFGPGIWIDWLEGLTRFRAINDQLAIDRLGLTPDLWAIVPALIIISALMWLAVRDGDRPRLVAATLGGSLLLSPHAVFYESAVLLLPALAMIGLNWRLIPIAYLVLGGATTTATLALTLVGLTIPLSGPGVRAQSVRVSGDAEAPLS